MTSDRRCQLNASCCRNDGHEGACCAQPLDPKPVVNHADIIRRVWSKRMPGQWAGPEHPAD